MLGLSVAIIEKQSRTTLETLARDGRDIALTHLSKKALENMGVLAHIPANVLSVIREARVFNGTSPRYMALSSSQTDQLAFIVANDPLRAAAYAAVKSDKNITLCDNVSLNRLALKDYSVHMHLSDGS